MGSCWGKRPKGRATGNLAVVVCPHHDTFQPHTPLPDSAISQSSVCAEIGGKVLLPFTSHMSSEIVLLQLNWLWVTLIVTLPITGTTPWYPPRDTQSRGPSLLLTLVYIEQNVKSTSHASYSFFNFGCKTTICFGIHRYAKCSSSRNKNGLRFGNLTPSPILPNLLFEPS